MVLIAHSDFFGQFFFNTYECRGVGCAGGLHINEFGTPSTGVAGAGTHAVAGDASNFSHNPAGMPRMKGKGITIEQRRRTI